MWKLDRDFQKRKEKASSMNEKNYATMTNVKFEELEVLLEPMVDLNNLAANEFDFRENFVHMGWMEYFSIERKPIYSELVKEFWMSARIINGSIYGCVQGKDVIICQQLLEEVIKCYAEGVKFCNEWNDEEIKEELEGIIFEKPNGSNYSDLNPEYKVLYKIISRCILPLGNSFEKVSRSYKFIMWHFAKKISINLPELMFDFLKRCIWFSRSGKVRTVPLGKVISACLETCGIVSSLKKSNNLGISQTLKQSFGPILNEITLAEMKVRSCDVVEKLVKEDKEAYMKPAMTERKKVNISRKRKAAELPPISTVIFPEDNKQVVLEYRKIVAQDLFRANPNYTPHVQYEEYDNEDNKDEVRKYMKKVKEEKAHQHIASSSGIFPKEPLQSDHLAPSRSSLEEELSKIVQQQQKIMAFMETSNQTRQEITNAINNLTSLVQKISDKS